jgi:cytochrome c peroxidase
MTLVALWLCSAARQSTLADEAAALHEFHRLRRPVAAVLTPEGNWLLVANRDGGSVSIIDTKKRRVVCEAPIGKRLSDLVIASDGKVVAVDEKTHELIVLRRNGDSLDVIGRLKVPHTPVSVSITNDSKSCFVTALWSRQLHVIDVNAPGKPKITRTIDLAFAPRELQVLGDDKTLVCADSFGGNIALVNSATGTIVSTRKLDGHNIRGMALTRDGKRLLLSHQVLNEFAATSGFAVHWGGVMKNVISEIEVAELHKTRKGEVKAIETAYLGIPDRAAGDPGEMLVLKNGDRLVAYSGTSEIAISHDARSYHDRIAVGQRPAALTLSRDERTAFVANTFSDSVSVVSLDNAMVAAEISLGPQPQLDLQQRGETLFYNARLSSDGWFSCHSCHTDGHTNGLLNDNFSDGSHTALTSIQYDSPLRVSRGGSKRVLSLLGTAATGPWAWDGHQLSLWAQIRKSIEVTMQGPSPPEEDVTAIQNYFYTLEPPPGVAVARGRVDKHAAARGEKLFATLNCADCHQPSTSYTTTDTYDVGLKDRSGNALFNPPSLCGVSQRYSLFHDSRAKSLREVFVKYKHNLEEPLATEELNDLLKFLESL